SIVDHEGRLAGSEVVAVRWTDRPGRSSLGRVAFGVSPVEGCSTPGLNVDPEVLLVPIAERLGILGAHEDAANASDSSHSNLRCSVPLSRCLRSTEVIVSHASTSVN